VLHPPGLQFRDLAQAPRLDRRTDVLARLGGDLAAEADEGSAKRENAVYIGAAPNGQGARQFGRDLFRAVKSRAEAGRGSGSSFSLRCGHGSLH
jgi:uncharacterized protein involved in type VI secretion and phage assembly